MVRLFLILSIIILVLTVWLNAVTGFTSIQVVPVNKNITGKMVNDKVLEKYHPCIRSGAYEMKEISNTPQGDVAAMNNSLLIVKGCDQHLTDIMNWLATEGANTTRIQNWSNGQRRYYLDLVYDFLTQGLIAENDSGEPKEEGSHHNHE